MADPAETLGLSTANPDAGIASLGLVTPDLLQAERLQAQRAQLAQVGQMNPFRAIGFMAGQGINNAVGQFASGAGMRAPIDPQMMQAQQNQQALNQAAKAAQDAGDDPVAQQKAYWKSLWDITKHPVAASNYMKVVQQDALAQERQAQMDKARRTGRQATPDEVAQYENQFGKLPAGHGLVMDADGKPQVIGASPPISLNIDTKGQGAGVDDAYKSTTANLSKLRDAAAQSVDMADKVSRARTLLDQGIISGPTAEAALKAQDLMAKLGITSGDLAARTHQFISIMKPLASASFKQGLGGGLSRITQWEMQMMQAAKGGDITTWEQGLRGILDEFDSDARSSVGNYNAELSRLSAGDDTYSKTIKKLYNPATLPEAPKAAPPAAPASAISYLQAHPELKDQFKAKYGYLPDGF